MTPKSPLDDPQNAAFAWKRYRRLLRAIFVVALVVTAIALTAIHQRIENAPIHLFIAAALGIIATIMMAGALMGLVFLSHGTGHDDSIDDPLERERLRDE